MSVCKGLIFPFFMSRSWDKQTIFKFTFEDFSMNFLLYKDFEYIIRKLKMSSLRLYNLFFFISFISKVTAQEIRVGRRIFRLFPCRVKKKTNKLRNYAISLVIKKKIAGEPLITAVMVKLTQQCRAR